MEGNKDRKSTKNKVIQLRPYFHDFNEGAPRIKQKAPEMKPIELALYMLFIIVFTFGMLITFAIAMRGIHE
jgi:hypothetical protein